MSTVDQLRRLFTWKLWKSITRKFDFPKKDKKIIQIGDVIVHNTKAIYSRIMCLISLINPLKVLNYKLPLIPYSKAMVILGILKPNPSWNLNNLIKLLVIITNSHIPSWLMEVQSFKQSNSQKKKRTLADVMETMYYHIKARLVCQGIYFVFKIHHLYSTKGSTGQSWIQNIANHHYFSLLVPLLGWKKA